MNDKIKKNLDLSPPDFENYRNYIRQICGLCVPDEKAYLVKQRLEPLVISAGSADFAEFYKKLLGSKSTYLRDQVIAAITTNETSFFRDGHPFDTFKKVVLPILGELIKTRTVRREQRKGPKVSIWSSGVSTGQEAYSLAMLIHEFCQQNRSKGISPYDFGILASDISSLVLSKAIAGEYSESDVSRGLPEGFQRKYFQKVHSRWVVKEEIRTMVEFRRINLIDSFALLKTFDVVFCRNVLIYFDDEIKKRIIGQFYNILAQDGVLFLGASELLYGVDQFNSMQQGNTIFYKKGIRS